MLISRTYRTWCRDYGFYQRVLQRQEYYASITSCPTTITELDASITTASDYVSDGFLALNINTPGGDSSRYIQLFYGDPTGLVNDPKVIYGVKSSADVASFSYVKIRINNTDYYIRTYSGINNESCSSNIIGTEETDGDYNSSGFVLANINNSQLRFIKIYTKT